MRSGIRFSGLCLTACAVALVGCLQPSPHGSGGGGLLPPDPPYSGTTVAIAGTLTFDLIPATLGIGLNYAAVTATPIRGATVEIWDASNKRVSRGVTDESGHYLLRAAANQQNRVVALAQLGDPRGPNTFVVDDRNAPASPPPGDPTKGKSVWGMDNPVTVAAVDLAGEDFNAASGVTGSAYTGPRTAAPFAILDVLHRTQLLIAGAGGTVGLAPLLVNWSPALASASYDPVLDELFLSGLVGTNTDEYDRLVIGTVWGYWFQNHYSRSDSLGGAYHHLDYLDDSVAFGAGFAIAIAGMANNSPEYVDTYWNTGTLVHFDMDLEADSVADTLTGTAGRLEDGFWSDTSVQEILWDLYDATNEAPADTLTMGFRPIFQVMTGPQKTTPYFTSIFTFLSALESQNPGSAAAIRQIAGAENIGSHNDHELITSTPGLRRYTTVVSGVVQGVDMDGAGLAVHSTYMVTDYYNKLFARQFFVCDVPSAGAYRITATTASPALQSWVELRFPGNGTALVAAAGQPLIAQLNASGTLVFSVGLRPGFPPSEIPFVVDVEPVTATAMPEPVGNG